MAYGRCFSVGERNTGKAGKEKIQPDLERKKRIAVEREGKKRGELTRVRGSSGSSVVERNAAHTGGCLAIILSFLPQFCFEGTMGRDQPKNIYA